MAKIVRPTPNIIDVPQMSESSTGEQKGFGQRLSEFSGKLFSDENNQRVGDYSSAIADLASPFIEGIVGAYGGNVSSLPSYRERASRQERAAEAVEQASKAEIERAKQKRDEELIKLREESSNRSFVFQEGLRQEYKDKDREYENERNDFEYNRAKEDTASTTMTGRLFDVAKKVFDTELEISKEGIRTANESSEEILNMRLTPRGQELWKDFAKDTAGKNEKIEESNRSKRNTGVPENALTQPLPISEQGFANYLQKNLAVKLDDLRAGSRNGTLNVSPTSIGKISQLAQAMKDVESGAVPANALLSVLTQIGEQVGEVEKDAVPVPTAQERFNSSSVVIGDDAIVPTGDGSYKSLPLGRTTAMKAQGEGTVLMAQAQLDRLEFEKQQRTEEVRSKDIEQEEENRIKAKELLRKIGGDNRVRAGMPAWLARHPDVVAQTEKELSDDRSLGFQELSAEDRAATVKEQLTRKFLSSTILDLTPKENANTVREKYINGTLDVRKDDYDQMAEEHVLGELEAQWKAEHEGYMPLEEWKATMGDEPYPFPPMPSRLEFFNMAGGMSGAVSKYHKVYAERQNEQIENSRQAYRQELMGLNIKTLNSNPEVARSAASIPNPFLSMGSDERSIAARMLGLGALYGKEMKDIGLEGPSELADILYDPANKLLPVLTPRLGYTVASSRSAGLSDSPVIRNLFGARGVVPYNDIPMPAESRGMPPLIDSNLSDAEAASVNQKMTEDSSAEMSAAKANRYAGFPEPLYENQYERMDEIATSLQQTMGDMNATGGKANQERASQFKRLQVALAKKSGGSADPRLVTPYMMAMSIDPRLVQLAQSTQKNLLGMDMPDGIQDPLTFVMKNTASAIEKKAEGRFWGTMPIEQKKMLLADSDKRIIFVPHLANTAGADKFLKPYRMGQAYVDLAGRVMQKKKGEVPQVVKEYGMERSPYISDALPPLH